MISAVSITIITVIGIIGCFAFICTATIFCCCALSSFNVCWAFLCGALLFNQRRKSRYFSISNHGSTDGTYENISNYSQCNEENESAPILINGDTVLAQAFLVAPLASPLAEARVIDHSIGIRNPPNKPFADQGKNESTIQQIYSEISFKDIWAGVLFFIQIIVVVWLAVQVSLQSMKIINPSGTQASGLGIVTVACFLSGGAATILGTVFLTLLLRNSEYIIEGVMYTNIAICVTIAIVCLVYSTFLAALISGGFAVFNYWYLKSIRSRIAFASAILSVACKAIQDNYVGTICAAYFMMFCQLIWSIIWSIASYGVYMAILVSDRTENLINNDENSSNIQLSGGQIALIILLFLSLHWGSEVIKSLMQTTVSGIVACWFFQPNRKAVVRGALFRSVTTSFGSICFGALIVSSIHTLRDILNLMSNRRRDRNSRNRDFAECIIKVSEYLLGYIEQALIYFNKYAYCYIAAYGMGFIESAKKVMQLFIDRGWTAIINDNLVSNALAFALFGITGVTTLFGAILSIFLSPSLLKVGISNPLVLLSLIGGLMGFTVASVLVSALNSGVAMVFVCMAENPEALKNNHPLEFELVTAAFNAFHPALVTWVMPNAVHSYRETAIPQGVFNGQGSHAYSPQTFEEYKAPIHKTGGSPVTSPSAPPSLFYDRPKADSLL